MEESTTPDNMLFRVVQISREQQRIGFSVRIASSLWNWRVFDPVCHFLQITGLLRISFI
jgi:hypothetical protein